MFISREEFLKQQAERKESTNTSNVGYFSLKDDGDQALVRFCYDTPDDIFVVGTHGVNVEDNHILSDDKFMPGKFRRFSCIRESYHDSIDKCPLCATGHKIQQRIYIKTLMYVEETGQDGNVIIVPKPVIWERAATYLSDFDNMYKEYGSLKDTLFKVTRNGAKGDKETKYSIMQANTRIYTDEAYPYVPGAFDEYDVMKHSVIEKSYDELKDMVGGDLSEPVQSSPRQVSLGTNRAKY